MGTNLFELDAQTTERCVQFGRDIVAGYERGDFPRSLAFSSHGVERDPEAQAKAKMAECIMALWLGQPLESLFYGGSMRPWDLLSGRSKIDVKRTHLGGKYLIWPINKNSIFMSKDFDILALVKNDWNAGFPRGWLGKWEFFSRKEIAGEDHKLTAGTWHVDESLLRAMAELPGRSLAEAVQNAAAEAARLLLRLKRGFSSRVEQ